MYYGQFLMTRRSQDQCVYQIVCYLIYYAEFLMIRRSQDRCVCWICWVVYCLAKWHYEAYVGVGCVRWCNHMESLWMTLQDQSRNLILGGRGNKSKMKIPSFLIKVNKKIPGSLVKENNKIQDSKLYLMFCLFANCLYHIPIHAHFEIYIFTHSESWHIKWLVVAQVREPVSQSVLSHWRCPWSTSSFEIYILNQSISHYVHKNNVQIFKKVMFWESFPE